MILSSAVSKDIQREYFVTFVCTLVLELFYFPELSLWGLLICGLLLYISGRELNPTYYNYPELGFESSGSFALFLLIHTAYMVVEFAAGFMSNSLGLISNACHISANSQFNYGRGRFEVLSGYVNAVFLVSTSSLLTVSVGGLIVNMVGPVFFHEEHRNNGLSIQYSTPTSNIGTNVR